MLALIHHLYQTGKTDLDQIGRFYTKDALPVWTNLGKRLQLVSMRL